MMERLRNHWPLLSLRAISIWVFVLIMVGLVAAQQTSNGQSLTVQARTLGVEVTFSEKRQVWRLSGAVLCRHLPPLSELPEDEATKPYVTCSDENALPDVPVPTGSISLGEGAILRIDAMEDGGVRIRLLSSGAPISLPQEHEWRPKDELILTQKAWQAAGSLRFDGEVVIGHQIEDGTLNYLIEGRYVVRERLMLHRVLEIWRIPDPVTVAQDELFLGDSVRIAIAPQVRPEDEPDVGEIAMARGFIAAELTPGQPGFNVVAASTPDQSIVTVRRFQNKDVNIEPRWLDRVRNDPMLIALSILMTLAGTFAVFGPRNAE